MSSDNNKHFFAGLQTVEEIKSHYRRLAVKYHPDKGGDLRIMQAINQQYHDALKRCDGQTRTEGEKEYRYKYEADVEQAVVDKIAVLIGLGHEDLTIALIGTWLWVTGNTRAHKDQLKALGLKYHAGREAWFFNVKPWRGGRSRAGLAGLAMKYGYREFAAQERERIGKAA
jgi:hypothetical protein